MIICAGESLIDFVPADSTGELYRPKPGGSPMNCAVAAARLGGTALFSGSVSSDFFGDRILSHLEHNGVDTSLVVRVDNPTTLAFVSASQSGDARYAFYTDQSADRAYRPEHLPEKLPEGAILQIGSISLIPDPESATLLSLAEQSQTDHIVALDPNIRPNLIEEAGDYRSRLDRAARSAAIIKISEEDIAWLYPHSTTETAVQELFGHGTELVVLTRGPNGSEAHTSLHSAHVPGRKVEVSDTIGAGDSFLAAILVWLDEHAILRREQLKELLPAQLDLMLGFATQVSALTCTKPGADPPRRDELVDEAL